MDGRFWKGALDEDKLSAYDTLHRCLCTVARLLVPFTPFISEDAFQTLVFLPLKKACITENIPESVLHAAWPKADYAGSYDKNTLEEESVIKDAVFLGRAARMHSGVKVRQPLARLFMYVEKSGKKRIIHKKQDILLEELNVKTLEFIDDPKNMITYQIKPHLPRIGKRLGAQVRIVQNYLQNTNPKEIIEKLEKLKYLSIPFDKKQGNESRSGSGKIELEKEDLIIESISKEGSAGAEGKGMFAALETVLNSELIAEGTARELVRNIQELRKSSDLDVTDRIGLHFYDTGQTIAAAVEACKVYIETETLARIYFQEPSQKETPEKAEKSFSIEKEKVSVFLWKLKESSKDL